jgi:hypothetical protein
MASTTTIGLLIPAATPATSTTHAYAGRRRISPQAGRGLEALGHAIEYLTDEYSLHTEDFSSRDEQLEAVQVLMGLNRQIYFECPLMPTFTERCRAFMHRH